jgi:hypothetical protein
MFKSGESGIYGISNHCNPLKSLSITKMSEDRESKVNRADTEEAIVAFRELYPHDRRQAGLACL